MRDIIQHERFKEVLETDWGFYVNCGNDDVTDEFNID